MIARAHAVGFFCVLGSVVGCAHGVVDAIDDTSTVHPDAGPAKDAAPQHPIDAAPAADTWQPPQDSSVDLPDTSPVCSPKISTGIPQCDVCEGQNCCLEDNACANSQDCGNLINCYQNCVPNDGGPPDQTCMSTCDSNYPQGANLLNAWGSCLQTNCANDCR